MPIYKVKGMKKDGAQKYLVRLNYLDDCGRKRQLTRVSWGLEAAKDMERKLERDIKVKGQKPVKKLTVKELFDEYIAAKQHEARETTIDKNRQNFERYILPTLRNIGIDKLAVSLLQDWKLSIEQRGLSLNTKKQTFSDFRAMLNYAVRMEYLQKNPLSKLGNFKDSTIVKKEMCYYTAHEFRQFISVAKELAEKRQKNQKDLFEWDFYVFFNIAFYTGLRKGEIHALKWSDLDGAFLSVRRSITQKLKSGDRVLPPKNRSSFRTLQMPAPLIEILNEHRERQAQTGRFSEDSLICGGELSLRNTTLYRRNELYAMRSGLKVIRIHDFRHSHVSLLANAGINIQEIARRLGHSRIEMTWNTYSHLYPREEERAVDILEKML